MLKEILLFMNWFVALIISIKYIKRTETTDFKNIFRNLLLLGIVVPIVEESLFRSTLYSLTNHLEYYKMLNAIIFGLHHLSNYFITYDIKFTIVQTIFAFYIGYYLVDLNNILMSMFIHSIYNSSMMIIIYIYDYFTLNDKIDNIDDYDLKTIHPVPIYNSNSFKPIRIPHCLNYDKLKKSKSVDDLQESSKEEIGEFYYVHPSNRFETKTIYRSILPEDIQESLENYNEALRQRKKNNYNGLIHYPISKSFNDDCYIDVYSIDKKMN